MTYNFPRHKPKNIEFVEQRKKNDCGVACMAMLTRRMYGEIVFLFPQLKRKRSSLYPDDVLEFLEDLSYEHKEVKKIPSKGDALIAVQWKKERGGHYVVWSGKRKQFLDPLHGLVDKEDMLKHAEIDYIWRVWFSEKRKKC